MAAYGGYTLDLYCDNMHQELGPPSIQRHIHGESGPSCRARARKEGWVFHKDGKVTCPICNHKRK